MTKRKRRKSRAAKRGWRTALWILLAGAMVFCALVTALYFAPYGDGFMNSAYAPSAFSGRRVLVLVPHEDDDLAMAGGVIRLYVDGGADVHVAFSTNGDNGTNPNTRVREALAGLSRLGVPAKNVTFLGYGDCWDYRTYKHIYHAPDDASIASESGRTETFGAGGQTDFHTQVYNAPASYTRANFLSDIRTLLVMLQPDDIFCIDLDSHTDHAGLSWMFEEALCNLLKSNASYRPNVYKGYAYATSWFSADDFYGENTLSTVLPDSKVLNDPRFPLDNPCYDWDARVRFPMPREALSYTLRSSILYRALAAHTSQDARFRAEYMLNGDTVFFERRTDNLLYLPDTTLFATSGDPSALNDFKLVDTDNLLDWPIAFTKGLWQPEEDDAQKSVTVRFSSRQDIASVSLYDFYEPDSNILSGVLTFSDGSTVDVPALHPTGRETVVSFPVKRGVSSFTFTITASTGDAPGLSELCAYAPAATKPAAWIKLTDESGNFLYRYTMKAGAAQTLSVYAYPQSNASYSLSVTSGNGDVTIENGVLRVSESARPGKHTVTARLSDQPDVYDTIEIVVPSVWQRPYHTLLSLFERALNRVEAAALSLLRGK